MTQEENTEDLESRREYIKRVSDKLKAERAEPEEGGVVIDLVTRQPMIVNRKKADSLAEYWVEHTFDLATYKQHAFLPIHLEDAVYECAFINDVNSLHTSRKSYDFPRGRLATVPMHKAWEDSDGNGGADK